MIGCLFTIRPALGNNPNASPIDIRVRFQFQSPTPQPWRLRLSLADSADGTASFRELRNCSTSQATSGGFEFHDGSNLLSFGCRHPIKGVEFELRVQGSRGTMLRIEPLPLSKEASPMPPGREISLADLLGMRPIVSQETPSATSLERSGSDPQETPNGVNGLASWTIQRVESDALRFENLKAAPLYESGKPLGLTIRTNAMTDQASRSCVLTYHLVRIADSATVQSHRWPIQIDTHGNSQPIQVSDPLPEVPGIYEIRVQVEPDEDNLWSRLRRRPPPIARLGQPIAVLSEHDAGDQESEAEPWRDVGVIRPSESTWSVGQWLPKPTARLIPGGVIHSGVIHSGVIPGSAIPDIQHLDSETHAGQSISILPAAGMFQATLPVKTPGAPHKVTIRLPSNIKANLLVQVGQRQEESTTSFVLERDATADQEGPWRDYTFVHYPLEEDQLWLTNLSSTGAASFESITVQAGPRRLVANTRQIAADDRLQPGHRMAALNLPGVDWVESLSSDVVQRFDLKDCDPSTIALQKLWTAAERISDYALAAGFNAIVIPANQGAEAWYESKLYYSSDDPAVPHRHHLEMLLRLLPSNRLQVYVGFKPNMLITNLEQAIRNQESMLVELTRSDSVRIAARPESDERQLGISRSLYSPLHPLVQDEIGSLVGELLEVCGGNERCAGIVIDCDRGTHLEPVRSAENDPGAVVLFGREGNMTGSVTELRNWIQQQGLKPFASWQTARLQQAYAKVIAMGDEGTVRLVVPATGSLEVANPPEQPPQPIQTASWVQESTSPSALTASFRYGPPAVLAKKSRMQNYLSSATGPLSGILYGEEYPSDSLHLVREQLLGDLSRMIDRTDPPFLMMDSTLISNGLQEGLVSSLRSFCSLPAQTLRESAPIDSASHTVRMRWANSQGHLYVSMISVVPWSCDVDMELSTPTQWELLGRDPSDSKPWIQSTGGARIRVFIPAGQVVVLRSKDPTSATIRSWTTRVSGGPEAIESIKQKITLIVERIGIVNEFKPYESLTNGGFEQSGGMGLVGWLHAQHPPGCVQIDEKESVEGSRSVMLTTSTPSVSRTWLVSETITPPPSGRLAVSLACRAESKEGDSRHQLRVSIEATRRGDPIRFTRDLEIPRNGHWSEREIVLEVDEIDTDSIDSLRLTIDSLSGGRVWIDDVQLHDRFPTAAERADLQSQAFLAMQGLQRGNLLPSGRLLQNHWSRHLLTLGPSEQPKRVIEAIPLPGDEPGVAERLRSWLPRTLRF